jgi:hypothetical protein
MNGSIAVMGTSGDTKIAWDSEKQDEVAVARAAFDKLVGKGYFAFKIKGEAKQGERITKFDPEQERMILVPPVAGG